MPDILDLVEQFRRQIEAKDNAALRRLADTYARSYRRLQGLIDGLMADVESGKVTRGGVVRLARYKELQSQLAEELAGFTGVLRAEIDAAGQFGIAAGSAQARQMMSAVMTGSPNEIASRFNMLHKDAIQAMLGFLREDGALYGRIRQLAPVTHGLVTDALTEGISLGYNPRKIAASIQNAYGQGLTDALRMTRTAQIYSYREANRATYIANADVVQGWIWHAKLDNRTCMSCVMQHGTIHKLDERLNGHYNCRCASIPLVPPFSSPIKQMGEEWFSGLSESQQRGMMGDKKYEAWKESRFSLGDLSRDRHDDVYGDMRGEPSLKELLERNTP